MDYLQLFKESIRLVRKNKLIWLFAILSMLSSFLPNIRSFQNVLIRLCLFIPSGVAAFIPLIATPGSFYLLYRADRDIPTTFEEAWGRGIASALRSVGLGFLVAPMLLVLFGIYYYSALKWNTTLWPFIALLIAVPFTTIYFWGVCAIAIHDAKATQAAEISLGISAKHVEDILIINAAYSLLRVLFLALVLIILALSPLSTSLPNPIELNFLTYQKINAIPAVSWATKLLDLLTWPWWLAVLTKTYTIFVPKDEGELPPVETMAVTEGE
ncbi:MAG: hypothetical protein JXB38_20190 [Anaerolineales bacterium]|nr:hypothetical protein [Anaerolineales bacterium]